MTTHDLPRILGRYRGKIPGPTLVCIGGIHGNEWMGILAIQRMLESLQRSHLPFHGEFIGLVGNRQAAQQHQRFIHRDFNRMWHAEIVHELTQPGVIPNDAEAQELQELWSCLQFLIEDTAHPITFLDLHSYSAEGLPFAIVTDRPDNLHLAEFIPVPVILGAEKYVPGTLMSYLNDLGYSMIVIEGGQHHDPAARDTLELAIWQTFVANGNLESAPTEVMETLYEHLTKLTHEFPPLMKIVYRHAVTEEAGFVMEPGFTNLEVVHAHQLLAHDHSGEIRAQQAGRIFLPLYQKQGNDGFFLVTDLEKRHPI